MHAERPFASIHIPKTGGVSLRKFWCDLYGPENIVLYSHDTKQFHRPIQDGIFQRTNPAVYILRDVLAVSRFSSLYRLLVAVDRKRRDRTGFDELPSDFAVVHGHFSPNFIRDAFPTIQLLTVVREPLERTLSGYFYLRKVESLRDHRLPPWYTRGMTFEEFAFLEPMVNYQTKFLAGFPLSEFSTVGTTDALECFCRTFDRDGQVSVSKLNSSSRSPLSLPDEFVSRFKEAYTQDYQLYQEAQCMRFLNKGDLS